MRYWLQQIHSVVVLLLFLATPVFASSVNHEFYLNHSQLMAEELSLLKQRLTQANYESVQLQHALDTELSSLTIDKVTKSLLNQSLLDIAAAKSNVDSVNIELNESQQTSNRLEKSTQEFENQLNLVGVFGFKTIHMGKMDVNNLNSELRYQTKLLDLEKQRYQYLQQLKNIMDKNLQLQKTRLMRIDALLKSQTLVQLHEQQAKSELKFQQAQAEWLKQLNALNTRLNQVEQSGHAPKALHDKLTADIFYVNENINFSYLQMLLARYQDQIQQLRISMTRSNSITLLNKINEQVQQLNKQLTRINQIIAARLEILERRKQMRPLFMLENSDYLSALKKLTMQYQTTAITVVNLSQQLTGFKASLDKLLQHELSSRQGLPGLESAAWLNLGAEILLLPNLAYHMMISLTASLSDSFELLEGEGWALIIALEFIWWLAIGYSQKTLGKVVAQIPDHESGHVNLKWLSLKSLQRNLFGIGFIINAGWLFYFCEIPAQNSMFFIHLAGIWLLFKSMITFARLYLVESVHDRTGADMRLYFRLKWTFITGGIITALAIYVQGLPVSYELKDLFARLFLLFLLLISLVLLKNWKVLPKLSIAHRTVKLIGLLVPFILIINSAVGLFGFVNLVYTISWYEGLFLLVLISYLSVRSLLIKTMEFFSNVFIAHLPNGWLWTEAFLKPIDGVLRIALFLLSWAFLFILYGWDQQSPVVERLAKLIHYRVGEVFNTAITPLSVIELVVIGSLLYWTARWTREFVYRLLSSRTQDLGIRNSIAILSQYTMIMVGILVGLRVLGIDLRALAVVAGAFAVTAGFGLRDIVNNLASGFLLLLERPLRVGDTVTIDGHEGEVIHLGSRAVIVRTWDHVDIFVPNAEICSKSFINWTSKDNIVRTVDIIDVDQTESALDIQKLIYEVLDSHNNVLKDPVPEVFVKELKEGHVRFEVRYFVNLRLIKSRPGLRSEILMAIWRSFEKQGIRPTYPIREIHVESGTVLSAFAQKQLPAEIT
jgi:potassium-dependent mechanosensitive channel